MAFKEWSRNQISCEFFPTNEDRVGAFSLLYKICKLLARTKNPYPWHPQLFKSAVTNLTRNGVYFIINLQWKLKKASRSNTALDLYTKKKIQKKQRWRQSVQLYQIFILQTFKWSGIQLLLGCSRLRHKLKIWSFFFFLIWPDTHAVGLLDQSGHSTFEGR